MLLYFITINQLSMVLIKDLIQSIMLLKGVEAQN